MRDWLRRLRFLLRPFLSRTQVHEEAEEELRFHLEMETRKLVDGGMEPEEARREARLRFGGVERFKEEVRDVDGVSGIEKLLTDGKYGLRVLKKNPVFALVGILTLALGIGASTAIFSVVDGILLRPLPYDEPDELAVVWADYTRRDGPVREWLSYPNYHEAAELDVFEDLATYLGWQPTLTGEGPPEMIQGARVSHGFFSRVLRVSPELGRGFTPADDEPGAAPVVLLSHGLWSSLFGADPDVVGRTLVLDDEPHTVIGVMPQGFRPPLLGGAYSAGSPRQDIWRPLRQTATEHFGVRGSALYRTVGRLADGMSVPAARAELERLGTRLEQEYPDANAGQGYAIFSLRDEMVRSADTGLWVLLGAVGFVLLLVCVNLANLVLARGAARTGEMAIRSAMGAGRRRLIRQLTTETMVLAILGGALGIGVAYLGTDFLVSMAPAGTPRLDEVGVDGRVLAFAAAVTLLSGVVFGLFPALRLSATDLRSDLAEGGRGSQSGSRERFRNALVGSQIAVALMLLVGAGLLLRSFQELHRVDLGFAPEGVLSAYLALNPDRYPEAQDRTAFVNDLERRLAALPGAERVGIVSTLPLSGFNGDTNFEIEGRPPPPSGQSNISWIRRVTPGYFDAMGLSIVEGRAFTPADDPEDDARVIIVNENLARRHFPNESALGKRLNFNDSADPVWREIVGVAKNVKNFGVRSGSQEATYFPYAQVPNTGFFLAVRTGLDEPASLLPAVRRQVAELDPQVAVAQATTMDEMVARDLAQERFVALLVAIFAAVALTLAAVGLYGVISYSVTQRMQEMGVRVALGADGGEIGRLVMGRTLVVTAGGLAFGVAGAFGLTRLLDNLLYEVSPTDPATFAATGAVLLAAALLAGAVPAWRASRLDPVKVLKAE